MQKYEVLKSNFYESKSLLEDIEKEQQKLREIIVKRVIPVPDFPYTRLAYFGSDEQFETLFKEYKESLDMWYEKAKIQRQEKLEAHKKLKNLIED